jgi:KaiC/GvpD/RAD55 family RecA-like ATPase
MESIQNDTPDRVQTFIEGFDNKIAGGIKKGHVVLLAGTPGTMKSSIALSLYTTM